MMNLIKAVETYQRGNHERALTLFQDVLTKEPENAYAHAHLSICLMQMGRIFAASEEADRALRADPELSLAHVARAAISTLMDDIDGASAAIDEALRIDPTNVAALNVRCGAALQERDVPALRNAAEALLQQEPDSEEAHYYLSRAAAFSRDGALAEKHAREALRIAPEDANAHVAIGWSFWIRNVLTKAQEAGLSALAINPNHKGGQDLLAAVEMRRRPLMGWALRVGIILDNLSIKQVAIYGAPAFLAYMIAVDVAAFFEFDRFVSLSSYALLFVGLTMMLTMRSYSSRMARNRKDAKLKSDY